DEAAARAVVDDPSRSLAFQGETLQSWHALLCPINHRGKTNWFANDDGSAPIAPSETDPGGPLLVLTTAGFDPLPPDELKADLPRRVDFIRNVEEVRNCFATAPGNLARGVFQMATMAEDGCTFSLWASDALMMESAYRPGIH